MAAYVIASIRVTDDATYEEYKRMVPETVAAYGGRYLVRGGRSETLEGDRQPDRAVLLEFPSYEDALAWHASVEYGPAKALRQESAVSRMILVEGV